jgi:hypothetical protein
MLKLADYRKRDERNMIELYLDAFHSYVQQLRSFGAPVSNEIEASALLNALDDDYEGFIVSTTQSIRVSPTNLARPAITVIEMAIGKMFAGNYIQKRSQTGAPSARNTVVLCLHMVSSSMNVTFSKKPDCTVLRGHSILACLRCVAGLPFLCSTALCCGAIHSICLCLTALCCGAIHPICHLSLPDCTVLRGHSVFARLRCDAELFFVCLSVLCCGTLPSLACQHCVAGYIKFLVYGVPAMMSGSRIFVEYYLLSPGMV